MTNNSLVSVVIKINNLDLKLITTINSILNQSYRFIQLILIYYNTCLCKDFLNKNNLNDTRIILIPTIDEGINSIEGDYIIFHSSSGISTKIRIKEQVKFLNSNIDIKALTCLNFKFHKFYYSNILFNSNVIDKSILEGEIPLSLSTIIIRRDVLTFISSFTTFKNIVLRILAYVPIHTQCKFFYTTVTETNSKLQQEIKLFNRSHTLQSRNYLFQLFNSPQEELHFTIPPKGRILLIVDCLNIGGTETYLFSIAKNLIIQGYYIAIASFNDGLMKSLFIRNNIQVYIINSNKDHALYDLISIISKDNFELVNCNLEKSMYIGYNLNKSIGIPYTITLHGLFYSQEVLKTTCPNSHHIICVSKPIYNYVYSILPNNKYSIIYNGVNIKPIINPIHQFFNKFIITYCSRLSPTKGTIAYNVIKNLFPLLQQNPTISILIIGSGSRDSLIIDSINSYNNLLKRNGFIYCGPIYNVLDYYNVSQIVIGTGRVVLEALSIGKATIAYGSSGYMGIVNENSSFTMLESYFGDHSSIGATIPNAIYNDVQRLFHSPNYLKEISLWGLTWCKNHFDEIVTTKDFMENSLNKK